MKVSKKILGAVLCGLIIVGGSNATLVKANAQTGWSMDVGFATHLIGVNMGTSYARLTLVLDNKGNLKLQGSPYVACNRTFSDTFRIGWKKDGQQSFYAPIVFRQCWQADAQKALRNVVKQFNDANIKKGDEIFIHGEGNNNSIKFYDLKSIDKPNQIMMSSSPYYKNYNSNCTLYENFPRHHTSFRVTNTGLQLMQRNPYDSRVCPR